jgi:hypothetical protein
MSAEQQQQVKGSFDTTDSAQLLQSRCCTIDKLKLHTHCRVGRSCR